MKNTFRYLSYLACCGFLLTGCEAESTAEISEVTNFAVFDLTGSDEILLHKGEEYVEPGATAEEAGEPVEVSTNISQGWFRGQNFDTDISDFYTVSYSAINQDGFEATVSRTIIVAENGDLVDDISGLYRSSIVRNGATNPNQQGIEYVLIWEKEPGVYGISDAIGGWYMYGTNYGIGYAAQGATITKNGPNSFTSSSTVPVGAFGGEAKITAITTNPQAKTIDITTNWATFGYVFEVHLEQVQF
ncbi:DUF5012 domain-containing protein [Antarcticibacterium sp. 1MA-6-2]|uniref:BT_2262 family domain-containing protein n=1 Tax=Antarcticibacterium sp. 1MA-6-2 TaxID=2908210 RepID=UPI001F1BC39E|nr:BT_2262 family domain-containing protein [Antarcticibacterium sp. 1MA-6-2]UJH92363.1 DUF5012 domain-containing protein [Antarcticibacterium sp. 1MA-6-2]